MSTGISWISPQMLRMPWWISRRKPAEMDTARIITRKEIAMETTAIFPLKCSLRAMKRLASIVYQM